jgi:DNA-binding protein HU-beta
MTKQDFIDAVYVRASDNGIDITKKDIASVVDEIFDVMAFSISKDDRFSYPKFGTFKRKFRKGRKGRNPANGEEITIPASYNVTFKPAPVLKDSVNR